MLNDSTTYFATWTALRQYLLDPGYWNLKGAELECVDYLQRKSTAVKIVDIRGRVGINFIYKIPTEHFNLIGLKWPYDNNAGMFMQAFDSVDQFYSDYDCYKNTL